MAASLPSLLALLASSSLWIPAQSKAPTRILVSGYSQTLAEYSLRLESEPLLRKEHYWDVGAQYMSWIEVSEDPNTFYAAHEMWPGSYDGVPGGAVSRWQVLEDRSGVSQSEWVSLGTSLGSNLPVHLVISQEHGLIYAANYGGSSLSALTLGPEGEVGPVSIQLDFPLEGDQCRDNPKPHQTVVRKEKVWVVDLGCDMIRYFHYKAGSLEAMGSRALESGAGPRHMALHPSNNLAFLVCELSNILHVYRVEEGAEGGLEKLQELPLLSDTDGTNYGGEIVVGGPLDRYVYVSSRGDLGKLVVYRLKVDKLVKLQELTLAGTWPRSIALQGDFLLALDQKGAGMEVFRVNRLTGRLTPVGRSDTPEQAAYVQFVRG